MSFTVVIPARFSSSRLPGKPLLLIGDKPMVQHVYERAQQSAAEKVIVATDDQRIMDAVNAFGGEVCMTSSTHLSGTDRIQEVAQQYQFPDDHIIVNVQGDEPLIPPAVIDQVATNLSQNTNAVAATLSEAILTKEDVVNPNIVKVVNDNSNMALYFSRAPIPHYRDGDVSDLIANASPLPQRHIGIYAYRVSLLHDFITWPPATLESIESLEQLRILAAGKKIHIAEACEDVPGGIDTPEDLERIKQLLLETNKY